LAVAASLGRPEVSTTHINRGECSHMSTVTVIAYGLERVICEDCGHVTVRYESMIARDVERSMFSRKADSLHATADPIAGA
jgi:hypothetical protein